MLKIISHQINGNCNHNELIYTLEWLKFKTRLTTPERNDNYIHGGQKSEAAQVSINRKMGM